MPNKLQRNMENMDKDQVETFVKGQLATTVFGEELKTKIVNELVARADEFENEEDLKEAYDLHVTIVTSAKLEKKKLTKEEKEQLKADKALKQEEKKQREEAKKKKEKFFLNEYKALCWQLSPIVKAEQEIKEHLARTQEEKKAIKCLLTALRQKAKEEGIKLPAMKTILGENAVLEELEGAEQEK